jgi:glucose/arabinose dehydrogenase
MKLFGKPRLWVLCLCGLVLAGCLTLPGQPQRVGPMRLAETRVSGAADPTAMAVASDGRVFYTEKNTGLIRVLGPNGLAETPFAEVPVNFAGQRGALGIALHPDFTTTPRVYLFYTRSDTGVSTNDPQAVFDNRVVYFVANGEVAAGGETFVAALPAAAGVDDVGGQIAFAADGTLLVAMGDLTDSAGAADPNVLVGKILRYNDDGSIPADNPTADSPVFASGLRNPGGLCIDPTDDAVFVIDNGPDGVDEVDRVPAGADLGWPAVTGTANTSAEQDYVAAHPAYVDPLYVTRSDSGLLKGCSFNTSSQFGPSLQNQFFFGQGSERQVMVGEFNTERTAFAEVEPFTIQLASAINDVAFTPAGTLYVATTDAVLRIVAARP